MSSPTKPPSSEQPEANETESIDRGRRRLMGMAVYVPPAVLGIISLQQAGCQPAITCNPDNCNPATQPCNPDVNPCTPNVGCNPDNCNPNA